MAEIKEGFMIWPKATKQRPCIICGKPDWCSFGDRAMICRRIESKFPHHDRSGNIDGWYHHYDGEKPVYIPPSHSIPKFDIDFTQIIKQWQLDATEDMIALAGELGVNEDSLWKLDFCHSWEFKSWAVAMRDGENNIIGIQLRGESKKCVKGSKLGLFIPQTDAEDVVFLPEGASDTAAFLTCGLYAIGRPSCNAGGEMLKTAIKRLGIKRAVIVVDNDSLKSAPNGREWRPGRDGAEKLQGQIEVPSCMWIPPSPLKDFRALLNKVGIQSARAIVTSSIAQKVWVRVRQ